MVQGETGFRRVVLPIVYMPLGTSGNCSGRDLEEPLAKKRKPRRTPQREAFERALRATVAFGVLETNEKGERVPKITGSGFATRAERSMVVTAKHVLSEDDLMLVVPKPVTKNADGEIEGNYDFVPVAEARAIMKHAMLDVAALIFPSITFSSRRSLSLEEGTFPSIGQPVATCGWPYGWSLQQMGGAIPTASALTGIVSAIYPHPSAVNRTCYLAQLPVNPGNSGGPVFDPHTGRVFGVQSSMPTMDIPKPDGSTPPTRFPWGWPMLYQSLRYPRR